MEQLEGDKGVENKLILSFAGKTLQLVCNKTNALCMKEMFGNKVAAWLGKRVTFYPTETSFGPKKVDAIRIFGSPDLEADVEVAARIGRKNLKMTLRRVVIKNGNGYPPAKPPAGAIDPRITGAFDILGWAPAEQAEYLATNSNLTPAEMLARLNGAIDIQEA